MADLTPERLAELRADLDCTTGEASRRWAHWHRPEVERLLNAAARGLQHDDAFEAEWSQHEATRAERDRLVAALRRACEDCRAIVEPVGVFCEAHEWINDPQPAPGGGDG